MDAIICYLVYSCGVRCKHIYPQPINSNPNPQPNHPMDGVVVISFVS